MRYGGIPPCEQIFRREDAARGSGDEGCRVGPGSIRLDGPNEGRQAIDTAETDMDPLLNKHAQLR